MPRHGARLRAVAGGFGSLAEVGVPSSCTSVFGETAAVDFVGCTHRSERGLASPDLGHPLNSSCSCWLIQRGGGQPLLSPKRWLYLAVRGGVDRVGLRKRNPLRGRENLGS